MEIKACIELSTAVPAAVDSRQPQAAQVFGIDCARPYQGQERVQSKACGQIQIITRTRTAALPDDRH